MHARRLLLALLLAFPLWLPAREEPGRELSEAVASQLDTLRALTEAGKFEDAGALVDRLLAAAPGDSFDTAILRQIKLQVLINLNRSSEAAEILDRVLAQNSRHLEPKAGLDLLYLLAQLRYQQASEAGDGEARAAAFEKALAALDRWFASAPAPSADARLFRADLLYNAAATPPPDPGKFRLAIAEAEKALSLRIKADTRAWLVILAARQQLGEKAASAELLELLVSRQPENSGYWQQLASTYLGLASEAQDEDEARRLTLRAVLAVERAQAAGHLRTSRENLNLVALYFNLKQFSRATDLLEKGLETGSIESTRRNWEFLASACQQSHRVPRALAALEKAAAAFPSEGQIEFALAQLLYGEGRPAEALPRLEKAVAKGNLEKPGQARLFAGYVAYELRHYEDALRWGEAAAAFDDVKKDDVARLSRAAGAALEETRARL